MSQKSLLIIVTCLASVFVLGEENRKFSLQEINIGSLEKSAAHPPAPLPDNYSGEGNITIKSGAADSPQRTIAYPVDESNFEEVFGKAK